MMNESILLQGNQLQNGKYIIDKVLGQGGFGITYLATFSTLKTKVAIKEFFLSGYCIRHTGANTISPQSLSISQYTDYKQKFIEEAQVLAQFSHPSIVAVTDIFEENNTAYFVMKFIEGKTLQEIVKTQGAIGVDLAINYIAQIAHAVEIVHKKGLLHRDIKPENIIITPQANAVLIDFGTARSFIQGKTVSHTAMLTPGYAPIEQYSDKSKRGAYTDVYGLGATLYHILTGKHPLDAVERLSNLLPEPKVLNPQIPEQVNITVLKALAIQPQDRYQTVESFITDLFKTAENENVNTTNSQLTGFYIPPTTNPPITNPPITNPPVNNYVTNPPDINKASTGDQLLKTTVYTPNTDSPYSDEQKRISLDKNAFNSKLETANTLFGQEKFAEALKYYKELSILSPEDRYIKAQIQACENTLQAKKKKTTMILGISGLVVVLIVVLAIIFSSGGNNDDKEKLAQQKRIDSLKADSIKKAEVKKQRELDSLKKIKDDSIANSKKNPKQIADDKEAERIKQERLRQQQIEEERRRQQKKVEYTPADVAGNWTIYYNFGCSGTYSNIQLALNRNGTFSSNNQSGTWIISGNRISIMFEGGAKTKMVGEFAGNQMKNGTLTSKTKGSGCWYGVK